MNLNLLRGEIDMIDEQILKLLKKRFEIVVKIGKLKKMYKIRIPDRARETEIIENLKNSASKYGIDQQFVEKMLRMIISQSKRIQKSRNISKKSKYDE